MKRLILAGALVLLVAAPAGAQQLVFDVQAPETTALVPAAECPGNSYLTLRAYDLGGLESVPSAMVVTPASAPNGCRVVWNANTEADLAGYRGFIEENTAPPDPPTGAAVTPE